MLVCYLWYCTIIIYDVAKSRKMDEEPLRETTIFTTSDASVNLQRKQTYGYMVKKREGPSRQAYYKS